MKTMFDTRNRSVHPPIHEITDALSFKLARLNAINERAGSYYFKLHHDITLNQWRILGLVSAMEPAPARDVRDSLYMDKGQFSRVVKQLVERRLIDISPAPDNASANTLRLTPAGRSLHKVLIGFTAERNARTAAVLTPEECETFLALLDKVGNHAHTLLMKRQDRG
ncbi:MarR family transcriptional regulator [Palleronia sediminis]|uniref:MarR family transcriptional regulator n=1 Tax=Palleronia sediminis TaxID=2547833 RepID=A0A4V3B971_9RHOB|nr:MarR family winged helix-turn-helix transcriptional regulator [Palleronia sediminis]TDL78079.1 MarR family transcriptional regulator [Palleronia sediminis]